MGSFQRGENIAITARVSDAITGESVSSLTATVVSIVDGEGAELVTEPIPMDYDADRQIFVAIAYAPETAAPGMWRALVRVEGASASTLEDVTFLVK